MPTAAVAAFLRRLRKHPWREARLAAVGLKDGLRANWAHGPLASKWWPALVLASIVHLAQSMHVPLELPAAIVAARVAQFYAPELREHSQVDRRAQLALVQIDQARFDGAYQGLSPLNRCQLAKDLQPLLEHPGIATVAIDLFLSPGSSAPDYVACQATLETLLAKHAAKIITIAGDSPAERAWQVRLPGLRFGNPRLSVEYGLVRQHHVEEHAHLPAFADLLAARLCATAPIEGANPDPEPRRPGYCGALVSDDGRFEHDHHPGHRTNPIEFKALRLLYNTRFAQAGDGEALAIDDERLTRGTSGIRHVLIGAGYGGDGRGEEDRRLTPVGFMSGARIHAAIAAQPRVHFSHLVGFAIDIALGALVFGPLVHGCWGLYFTQRMSRSASRGQWRSIPRLAYGWLVLLALAGLLLTTGLLVFSAWLYAQYSVWISPAPMAIGMAIEGMVMGSVHTARHMLELPSTVIGQDLPHARRFSRPQRALLALPTAGAAVLVLVALYDILF